MNLSKTDHIVTAFATYEAGPGWANSPLWIIIKDVNGQLREECLQPEEQSREIRLLFPMAAQIHQQLKAELKGRR